jgi:phosphate transport system protein
MALPADPISPLYESESAYLATLALRAFRLAKSAASYAADGLGSASPALFDKVDGCEKELDQLDRELDQRLSASLAGANEARCRELLACMKCMGDLERIGDLIASFSSAGRAVGRHLESVDIHDLIRMASVLEKMLADAEQAFSARDINRALNILRADGELDRLRNLTFVRHVDNPEGQPCRESIQVLLMAQALERAGDHVKNVAEEICYLVTGRTLRHVLRSRDRSEEQMFIDWLKQRHASRG